jgi:hypothetical protein
MLTQLVKVCENRSNALICSNLFMSQKLLKTELTDSKFPVYVLAINIEQKL